MRDMNPADRSIRNIPLPAHHRRPQTSDVYEEDFTNEPPRARRPRRRGRGWFFWSIVVVVLVCAIGGVLLSTLFVHVTVNVALRHQQVQVPPTLQASLNPAAGALGYSVLTTSRTASTSVKASGSQQVSKSASGIITIYNNYSGAPQQLVANTRFEAPNGNIYRIHAGVTIPGATQQNGTLTPGSVSATAYADKPGADYNISTATQFTIPGFKGDPKYDKFYAQSSAITGGFVGTQPAVAQADLTAAQTALKNGLDSSLQNTGASGIPADFTVIPGTLQVSYADVAETPQSDGTVTLAQTASATLDVVRTNDLAAAIARAQVQNYNGEAVGFADPSALKVSLATSSASQGPITLAFSGTPTLVLQFDPDTLKQALLGKPKSQFETIIDSFAPAIDCSAQAPCTASMRPFWKTTFPTDPAKITVSAKAF